MIHCTYRKNTIQPCWRCSLGVDGIRGQLLLSTKLDPQCIVILDTKIYVLAGFKLSTFFLWSWLSYHRPCDILRRKKIIHSYSRDYFEISQDYDHIGGATMVKWNSPPTNVTWIRSPYPPSYEGRVCCLFLTKFSGFPSSTKTNTFKF